MSTVGSPTMNVTSSMIRSLCGIPYEECLCAVQLMKNERYKDCLTDYFLMSSRIFILFSFIMQIYLIRDLFTLRGNVINEISIEFLNINIALFSIILYRIKTFVFIGCSVEPMEIYQ
ncbi:hypothetical protein I4U23_011843 [Adineta vaga]|nr:hypothetical protein I4U23_011843 [Adineta vaga]